MRAIGAFEARNKLGTLLDWVAAGEEFSYHCGTAGFRRTRLQSRASPASSARSARSQSESDLEWIKHQGSH